MTPVLWGEEFGWRGYLQIRLFADRPTLAAVLTGLIWSVWHLPVNLIGYNDIGNLGFGMVLFTIGTMMTSVIFGWFQERTGSNWAASLAHAANNGLGGTLAMLLFQGGENYSWVSYGGILSLVPLSLFCAWIVVSRQASQPRYRKILEKVQG
jgi:membrane protease YdiL (CAAX protease family)